MKFSKKLKRIGAMILAVAMVIGLLQTVPGGAFVINAKAADKVGDQTWKLMAETEADVVTIQGKTAEWKGLTVDATAATGKLYVRTQQWAQFNTGTIIKVPVDGNCNITVVNYDTNFTINGVAATDKTMTYKYEGEAGYVDVVATGNSYIDSISTEHIIAPTLDTSKADVWDFGGQALEGAYNNNIDYDFINSCYNVEAGTTGVCITSFTAKDGAGADAFKFVTNKTNSRWRMTPAEGSKVTYYDKKTKQSADGATNFAGYLYSNASGATPTSVDPASANIVQTEFYLYAGDILTCWLGSNGGVATYALVDEEGKEAGTFEFTNNPSGCVQEAKFYAAKEGWYTLYCKNEKLVLARAIREHTPVVTVSGTVEAPETIPAGYGIAFTNTSNGSVKTAKVTDGKYSVDLNGKYSYAVSLKDANGYVVETGASLELGTEAKTLDVKIKAIDLLTVTGTITGMPSDQMEKMQLQFTADAIYVPEMTVDTETGAFTLKVEKDIEYAVTAENVNDYELKTTSVKFSANTADSTIAFEKKPTYKAEVKVTGLDGVDTGSAVVTFTNINEAGYVYTYGINDDIQLRNGQYKVHVSGLGEYPYVQSYTADVKINDAPGSTSAAFTKINDWNIQSVAASNAIETKGEDKYFAGLKIGGNVALNKSMYLLTNADSTVTIPNLKAGDVVTLKYCYCAAFAIGDITVDEKSGSTSQIDSVTYTVPADGDVIISAVAGANSTQTYFTEISVNAVAEKVAYKETVTVGADKEYKTINDALAAVRKMERDSATQNVTIMIDPGNYEEMLVIDTPNVTFKNASANASIELKNKGVDIDENAVRVTWYYGHGYTYYSMGSDCKFDADLLAVNQSNGYPSFKNPGTGTTSGSYWNATVVVTADNVSADGIIFENSFNQYVSPASVKDTIVSDSGAKNGSVKRDDLKTAGDTVVQQKAYVERAACLAIYSNVKQVYFNNCKFIGRQDTLYGGAGVTAAFNECSVYGGTDYIFGGMTAVFNKCDLVFNTSEGSTDVGYITAPQQTSGRGYLFNECVVTSTTPGVDTASEYTSKPGYFGRPWQSNTGEAVFYNTTVEAADAHWSAEGEGVKSLISPAGWLSTLSGESALCGEFGTIEKAGVDNLSSRASWATVFTEAKLADGNDISIASFLGAWDPFSTKEEEKKNGFYEENGAKYWYEDGVKQGTGGRGKEIYDPKTDAWYWLDSVQGGAVATSKDVYQEYDDGTNKWVRYDKDGHMVKGWDTNENGKYYFDPITGAMAKGVVNIDGTDYRFNDVTGVVLDLVFVNDNGNEFWYENGIKQGTQGRGKEIYDPATDGWYWLDAIDGGKKAVSKDVYQESYAGIYGDNGEYGKWVRYDAEGKMVKGWSDDGRYYFDEITGAMAKGKTTIDGKEYTFDKITGILDK